MSVRQIILYELNEVPEILINRFKKDDKLFNNQFSKFSFYKTRSYDEVENLSPWITWPTLHRGTTFKNHNISNLGQDLKEANKNHPPIWEKLKELGFSVGVYGSLHSNNLPENFEDYEFYLPDPFSPHSICKPKYLSPFQSFN